MTADSLLSSGSAVLMSGPGSARSAAGQQAARLLAGGSIQEAAGVYLDLLERDPHDAGALVGLARCEAALGRPREALVWARMARRHAQRGAVAEQASVLGAEQLHSLGLLDEAHDELLDSSGLWATARRASILIDQGRFDEAAALAQTLGDDADGAVQHALLLGRIALRTWRPRDAAEIFAAAVDPSRPWLLQHIAAAQIMELELDTAYAALAERATLLNAEDRAPGDSTARPLRFLLGNILNELLVDRTAAEDARAARDLDGALNAVRSHPDTLGPSLALLLRLRREGRLGDPARAPLDAGGIPRRLVLAWFGSSPPPEVEAAAAEWERVNPGWSVELFDANRAVRELRETWGRPAARAFGLGAHPATRADFFRLATLAAKGGVWVDVDDHALAPIDPLVEGRTLIGYQEQYGFLANDVLGCAPGHPAIVEAMARAQEALVAGFGEATWLATGPGLLTRAAGDWLAAGGVDDPGLLVLEQHAMRRYAAIGVPMAYKGDGRNWRRQ